MRRYLLLALLLTALSVPAWCQTVKMSPEYCPVPPVDSTLTRGQAARDNLWPGFGTGSRRQADVTSATTFKLVDITGVTLTGAGAIGLAATALQQNGIQHSVLGNRSNAPYFIFGGVAAAGVATLTVSRILAVRKARVYDAVIFPTAVPGGGGMTLSLRF